MTFSIYKLNTGEFTRVVCCPKADLLLQYDSQTEGAMDGYYTCNESFVSDAVVLALPEKPSAHHTFDYDMKAWVDPRTLQDFKDAKWLLMKVTRDAAELANFTYNSMVFDGDLAAQRRLGSYISVSKSAIAAGVPFSAEFTLANNTAVVLTAQDFVAIEMAKVQQVAEAFTHARGLRVQIEVATTAIEVEAVVW